MKQKQHTCCQFTLGGFRTEGDAEREFDRLVEASGLFRVYREVSGEYLQPRPGTPEKGCRIDRIVCPTQKLVEAGWRLGPVGVELKKSETKLGKVVAQCQDYMRAAFTLPAGTTLWLGWVFIFPVGLVSGDLASLMSQHRIGAVRPGYSGGYQFYSPTQCILSAKPEGVVVQAPSNGGKVGSR